MNDKYFWSFKTRILEEKQKLIMDTKKETISLYYHYYYYYIFVIMQSLMVRKLIPAESITTEMCIYLLCRTGKEN